MKKKLISWSFSTLLIIMTLALVINFSRNKGNGDEIDRTVEKYNATGASIALIENGKITEIRNYGYENKEEGKLVNDKTRFKIASISKTVTAYAIMQLVEENKLDLDVPVNEYLKKWKIPESEYGEDKVTLRNLLSHTSGVTGSREDIYDKPLPSVDEALKLNNVKLKREPGSEFEYSEFSGYGICQLVIEDVTGMKFENYMEKYVFESLGMKSTDFANSDNEKGSLAVPYAGKGCATKVVPIVMNGAGGVTTTSFDLAQFEIELMNYYASGCGEMFKPQENTLSDAGYYGLGIIPRKLKNGYTVYEHNGTLTGWNSQLVISPETKSGIAVVSNSDKAYYMTYELMEVWSSNFLGEKVSDSVMANLRQIFMKIEILLLISICLFAMILIRKMKKKKLVFAIRPLRTGISIVLLMLYLIIDYIVFYKDWMFNMLYGMEDYYLFTFFPPEFKVIQCEIIVLLILILIRLFNIQKPVCKIQGDV